VSSERDGGYYGTNELEAIAKRAADGKKPTLDQKLGRELLFLLKVLNAPKRLFDPEDFGSVIEMDVLYEGMPLCPDREKIVLSIGAGGHTRQIRMPAHLALGLTDLIHEAIPNDGEEYA
jgi:hypothetical protein